MNGLYRGSHWILKKTQLNLPENKIFQNAYSLSLLKPIKKDVGPIPHMCRVYYSF